MYRLECPVELEKLESVLPSNMNLLVNGTRPASEVFTTDDPRANLVGVRLWTRRQNKERSSSTATTYRVSKTLFFFFFKIHFVSTTSTYQLIKLFL